MSRRLKASITEITEDTKEALTVSVAISWLGAEPGQYSANLVAIR
jgi:hypothetical protein